MKKKILTHRRFDDGSYVLEIHMDESRYAQDQRHVPEYGKETAWVAVTDEAGNAVTGEDGKPVMEQREITVQTGWKTELVGAPYPDPDFVLTLNYGPVPVELEDAVDEDGNAIPDALDETGAVKRKLDSKGEPKPTMTQKKYEEMQVREGLALAEQTLAAREGASGRKLSSEDETH